MNQATLELAPPTTDIADRTGFDIGWDHARHGLVPPAPLLHAGTPVCQGWMAGRAVLGRRAPGTHRTTRQWLQLRLLAWRAGVAFDTRQVTPQHLARIHVTRCPVLRRPLGGTTADPAAPVVERLDPHAGYVAGNLAVIGRLAAQAREDVDLMQAVRHARLAELGGEPVAGLDAAAWWRLAVLRSFVTPLPLHQAARLPLAVLPPAGVRPVNGVQRLQLLVTLQFAAPGWSERTRDIAALLPEHTLRHDFNLFVGALAPRVLEAGANPADLPQALEDAWLHERVQRRWQHFALSLGEAGVESLLAQAGARGPAPPCARHPTPAPGAASRALAAPPRAVRRRTGPPPSVPASRASAHRLHAAR